ncbi:MULTISPECIES: GNAT family N-acetyltransferase [Listeria]|uniref:GNAT family N-acetyltransferase n=1 Tax=Listeria TaxID=1637 RepID=UPI001F0719AE|nr:MULTISPECIES: GNAT family N-acetyltransferase [Listeria]
MEILIEKMQQDDYVEVAAIHLEGIKSKNATFLTEPLTFYEWDAKYLKDCRFVAKKAGEVIGWAALLPFSSMPSYRGVAEISIYIAKAAQGMGVGKALMRSLITESEKAGFWTLTSLVFPENQASIALHHKFGFETLCIHKNLGKMDGVFRDVALLERRNQAF